MGHQRRRRRDEDRLRALIDCHHDAITRFFRRRLADGEVDDAVATVFTTAWRRIDDVPSGPDARAWLYGVARNTVRHQQRSVARRSRLSDRLTTQPAANVTQDPADVVSARDWLTRAARQLSADDVELLELISWEQLQPKELAVVLGCSANAAAIRVHRMRRALAAVLQTHPDERTIR